MHGFKLNTVAWVVELTYLCIVVKCESFLGGHGKARCTVTVKCKNNIFSLRKEIKKLIYNKVAFVFVNPSYDDCCICILTASRDSVNFDSSSVRNTAHLFGIPILFHELANSTNMSQKSDFDVFSKYPFSLANLRCSEGVKNGSYHWTCIVTVIVKSSHAWHSFNNSLVCTKTVFQYKC